MKKLLVLLFSMLISFNSYGEWTPITKNVHGDTYYVDFERIKRNDGNVYYWQLVDYLEPLSDADGPRFSGMMFYKVDCDASQYKRLTLTFYSGQMSNGSEKIIEGDKEWSDFSPGSAGEVVQNELCNTY